MSCVIGLVDGDRVYIGADSAGIAGYDVRLRADRKVFKRNGYLFGFAGSYRMGQLLQYSLPVPVRNKGADIDKYMRTDFINAVRKTFTDGGFSQRSAGQEVADGAFLVAAQSRLFLVEPDFQIGETVDRFLAIGCGSNLAMGSLHSTEGKPAAERIRLALEAAQRFNAGVRSPFFLLSDQTDEIELLAAKSSEEGNAMGTNQQEVQVAIAQLQVKMKDTERRMRLACAAFDENKVKRDKGGKFAKKEGGGSSDDDGKKSPADLIESLYPKLSKKDRNLAIDIGRTIDRKNLLAITPKLKDAAVAFNKFSTGKEINRELNRVATQDAEKTHQEVEKVFNDLENSARQSVKDAGKAAKEAYKAARAKGLDALDTVAGSIELVKDDADAFKLMGVVAGVMTVVAPMVAVSGALGMENKALEDVFLQGLGIMSLTAQQVKTDFEAEKEAKKIERIIKSNTQASSDRVEKLMKQSKAKVEQVRKDFAPVVDAIGKFAKKTASS